MHLQLDPSYFGARQADRWGVRERYDSLDDSIQAVVTEEEFAWLPDADKARLQQDLTEPNPET